jgi:uncharacterized protein (UPF0332 family)
MIKKAKAHLETAKLLYRQHHYRDAVSRPYYAAFSAIQTVVSDPPRGRWEHPGLRGAFVAKLAERGLAIDTRRELSKRLRYLLDAREGADCRVDEVEACTVIDALEIARETLRLAEEFAT